MPSRNPLAEQIRATKDGDKLWQQERTILEATERICELMEKRNVNRVQLAEMIDKHKSRVSQLLDGTANMTLRTLSDIYFALGRAVKITDTPLAMSDNGSSANGFVHVSYRETARWETSASQGFTSTQTRIYTRPSQPVG
jgi:hypothetical protein